MTKKGLNFIKKKANKQWSLLKETQAMQAIYNDHFDNIIANEQQALDEAKVEGKAKIRHLKRMITITEGKNIPTEQQLEIDEKLDKKRRKQQRKEETESQLWKREAGDKSKKKIKVLKKRKYNNKKYSSDAKHIDEVLNEFKKDILPVKDTYKDYRKPSMSAKASELNDAEKMINLVDNKKKYLRFNIK